MYPSFHDKLTTGGGQEDALTMDRRLQVVHGSRPYLLPIYQPRIWHQGFFLPGMGNDYSGHAHQST